MNYSKILTRDEIAQVLKDLVRRAKRSENSRQNLIIFRLSCCCGLRRKEIAGLNLNDIITVPPWPALRVRKAITKGQQHKKKGRRVPLWWDAGTLADLRAWREQFPLDDTGPFVRGINAQNAGQRLTVDLVAKRWRTAIKILGPERLEQLSIHSGRHSFCSHALFAGRSAAEVRDAAGHTSVAVTNIYLHALESGNVPDIFNFDKIEQEDEES